MYMNTYRMEGKSRQETQNRERKKKKGDWYNTTACNQFELHTEFYVNISLLNLRSLHQQENN